MINKTGFKVSDKSILSLKHSGFPSKIDWFTNESIASIPKTGFKHHIVNSSYSYSEKDKIASFDIFCTDKSKLYDFVWNSAKYARNLSHNIGFSSILDMLANIEKYAIERKFDNKHYDQKTSLEKRWNYYLFSIPLSDINDTEKIGKFLHLTYTMRMISLNNDNRNHILALRIISLRYAHWFNVKKELPLWWKENVDMKKEKEFADNSGLNDNLLLEDEDIKQFYTQVTDLLTKTYYEEWLSVTDIKNMAGIFAIHENISKNVKNVNQYLADTVDYCKLYAFDPEIDSYDDFSEECANRIKMFNLRNSVAFNRSITNLRKAGIHLPDGRDRQYGWPDYEKLRMLIESGGDQKEILRLFPIVFAEYAVMPGDVDINDPETYRYITIGGMFPYVYLDNMLPHSEYSIDNPWNIEKGKKWLKDRQIALLEDK